MKRIKRRQTIGEEIANAVSHGIMALFGIFILVFCLIKSDYQPNKIAGAIVYGMSTVALFTISCLYHALTNETAKSKVFKRLDHISIYLLIGGTYTPILLNLSTMQGTIGGTALTIGWLIFIIQWSLIIVGITFKSIWLKKLHWIHLIIFLALGWTAVFFINNIFTTNLTFFLLILFGGISYTIGVVFYILSGKVKYFHFVWHLFVNIGCILHGLAIILFLY